MTRRGCQEGFGRLRVSKISSGSGVVLHRPPTALSDPCQVPLDAGEQIEGGTGAGGVALCLHADDITEPGARAALQLFDPLWDKLFPAEQARIVALPVERVDIGTDGLNMRLRVDGPGGLAREMPAGGIKEAA